jgi:hypothetical protein
MPHRQNSSCWILVAIAGTWILQQVANRDELDRKLRRSLSHALRTPHIRGFCLRFPWKTVEKIGERNPIFFCQANGWGPRGDWGAPNAEVEAAFAQVWQRPICRGQQAIQPADYAWPELFRRLYENRATYCEVYAPSFTLKGRAQLAAEIRKFDEHLRAHGPLLPEPPPKP